MNLARIATEFLAAGISVIPCRRLDKRPVVAWRQYQTERMDASDAERLFATADAIGIVCGAVSGGVEMIDFDLRGEAFDAWRTIVDSAAPGLVDRLLVERTQSGGLHVVYRLHGVVPGNAKLAERRIAATGPEPVRIGSRPYTPRRVGDEWVVQIATIETRGEGGMFLAAPTEGYEIVAGSFDRLAAITIDERDILIGAATSLSEIATAIEDDIPIGIGNFAATRPGDAFNAGGDIEPVLRESGWTLAGEFGGQQHWLRPGKSSGTSATLKDGVFYCFSSSAAPFEPNRGYSRFATLALLRHGGDYTAAAAALASDGWGKADDRDIDLSAIIAGGIVPREETSSGAGGDDISRAISYRVLVEGSTGLRPVVIDGLLREGESMNVIAAPKTGKSWLTIDLALAVATGRRWLGRFDCRRGRVLMLDNELHRETSAYRIPRVAEARGIAEDEIYESLFIDNLRGRLLDFHRLRPYLASIPRGWYRLIILDAFYRFMPAESDENSNSDMARIYSQIDHWADRLGSCIVLVHHTSKGIQSGKSVTDVGSGAGAQSRATDTHLVLRQHEEDDAIVLDAAVRSFAPISPVCLRWEHPVFDPDYTLDPTALRGERKRRGGAGGRTDEPAPDEWTAQRLVELCLPATGEEVAQRVIEGRATAAGMSDRLAKRLLREAIATGRVVAGDRRYAWRMA